MSESGAPAEAYLLRYFLTVVERGGVAPAAETLAMSPELLEHAMAKLERRMDTALFIRDPFAPTAAGERLAVASRSLLELLDGAGAKTLQVRDLQRGRLDVVSYSAFTVDPLVYLVARFRRRYPNVRVDVHHVASGALARDAVRSGVAELAVVDGADGHVATDLALPPQENVLVGIPSLVAGLPDRVPRTAAVQLPLILDAAELPLVTADRPGVHIEDAVEPNVVVDSALPLATWRLVAAGEGVTITSRRIALTRIPGAVIRSLDPPLIRIPVLARRSDRLSPAAKAFVELAEARRVG